ncbi:MAG TPA: hypothetical protein PLZ86_04850, partial [bacterium]|nr:hypothetical protein [bacterium]
MPSLESALVWAALLSVAVLFFLHRVGTSDLFWQMKAGELLWETGSIPRFDIFSYTAPGNPWLDHEWLSGLLFFRVWRAGGFEALSLMSLALGLGIVCAVFSTARRLSGSRPVAILLALLVCAACAQRFQQFRPDLFGFLFFAVLLRILSSEGLSFKKRLFLLVALHVGWVNLHASAIIGPPLVFIFLSARLVAQGGNSSNLTDLRGVFLLSAFSAAALLANPFFTEAPTFP